MSGFKKEAFESFDRGLRPSELSIKGVKKSTLYRYYQEWKKLKKMLPGSDKVEDINVASDVNRDNKEIVQILARFEQFEATRQFLFEKGQLEERIRGLVKRLEDCDERYCQWSLIDKHWQEEAGNLMEQLQDFALSQVDMMKTSVDLQSLTQIVNGLESILVKLENQYDKKIRNTEQKQKEVAFKVSKNILEQKLAIPLIPASVRSTIENTLLVQSENEANNILEALIEYAARNDVIYKSSAKKEQIWSLFKKTLAERDWDFVNELKTSRDESMRMIYGEWLHCPLCQTMNRVTAKPIPAVYRCIRCGNLIQKRFPGRIALPV